MTSSSYIADYLKTLESFRPYAYRLANESGYTIGFGNRYYENGQPVGANDTITLARAEQLFQNILRGFAEQVNNLVYSAVNQNQFDALVSYAYNRGIANFANSKLLQMVNSNPNNPDIYNQFLIEWGTNTAYKAALIERRRGEAELYFSPPSYMVGGFLVSAAVLTGVAWLFYDNVIKTKSR